MIKSDKWLRQHGSDMILPFQPYQIRAQADDFGKEYKVISYGLSSFGYDIRLSGAEFGIFSAIGASEVDPKSFDPKCLVDAVMKRDQSTGAWYWKMPSHSYALGVSIETFDIPCNIVGLCVGKSTYARSGLIVNTTPLEPGWRGKLVLEFSNPTDLPIRLYINEGIAQIIFFESDENCEISYADRSGKYQDQIGLTLARV